MSTLAVRNPSRAGDAVSIFWPVLFIGGGVLLILGNLGRLQGDLFEVLIAYWPAIFILIGLDILFSRAGWIGTVVSGLSALAVVGGLAYLLMTPGAGLTLAERLPALVPATSVTTTDLSYPLGGVRRAQVELSLLGGRSTLSAAEEGGALFDGSYTHRDVINNDVTVSGADARVRIGAKPGVRFTPGGVVREAMSLSLNPDVRYDIDLSAASGRHQIDLSGLDVRRVGVSLASGNVDLTALRTGRIDVSMASGIVRIKLPPGAHARVEVSTLAGDVVGSRLTRVSGNRVNGVYETPTFSRVAGFLDINVSMVSGTVMVE
jgi:hypothetical protein